MAWSLTVLYTKDHTKDNKIVTVWPSLMSKHVDGLLLLEVITLLILKFDNCSGDYYATIKDTTTSLFITCSYG